MNNNQTGVRDVPDEGHDRSRGPSDLFDAIARAALAAHFDEREHGRTPDAALSRSAGPVRRRGLSSRR